MAPSHFGQAGLQLDHFTVRSMEDDVELAPYCAPGRPALKGGRGLPITKPPAVPPAVQSSEDKESVLLKRLVTFEVPSGDELYIRTLSTHAVSRPWLPLLSLRYSKRKVCVLLVTTEITLVTSLIQAPKYPVSLRWTNRDLAYPVDVKI